MGTAVAPSADLPGQALGEARVLGRARGLWQASRGGRLPHALRNKNIGLVCASDAGPEGALLRQAAAELGAHVSDVRPGLDDASSASDVGDTARMLSRLYDAVVLQGQPRGVAKLLRDAAAVPVLDSVASAGHPTAVLAAEIDPALPPMDARRLILQAVLLGAMA